jgi:competence protein ComEA
VRVRAALGGVVVLALLGVGAAVVGAVMTPGGQTVEVAPVEGVSDEPTNSIAVDVVVLHVIGAVTEPGIVELTLGSRVVDAIATAGGPAPDADLSGVNLARIVADGEQLRIPRVGEVAAAAPGTSSGVSTDGLVNINTADATALETLPGVGPAIAARIIAWRDENGPFRSVDELSAVSGIGEKTLDGMRDQATV